MIWYDTFVNWNWVDTRWQQYSAHLHTNITQNNTIDTNNTLGGSSTVHIYTQTLHRTTQSTQTIHRTTQLTTWLGRVRAVPVFASYSLAFALQLRKKHWKTCQTSVFRYLLFPVTLATWCIFCRVPEQVRFIVYESYIRQDILWQLSYSGTW